MLRRRHPWRWSVCPKCSGGHSSEDTGQSGESERGPRVRPVLPRSSWVNARNRLVSRCPLMSPGLCLTPLLFLSCFPSGGSRLPSLQVCPAAYSPQVPKLTPSGKRWKRQPTEWRFAGYPHPALLLFTGTDGEPLSLHWSPIKTLRASSG